MTATPIPRTIALTLYAELDISAIPELPPGRLPVKTWLVPDTKRPAAYTWMREQFTTGAQAFIVCPFINDSATPLLDEVKAAETEYLRLKTKIFPDLRLGLIHGQLKTAAKTKVIQTFKDQQLDILVATPVIEVGIDIPQATIMVIEGAERFGLASLHQLRGRVGRGDRQSYCLLFTTGKTASKRLTYLTQTYSGLHLAEFDLKLRGPGDLYGTRQSGYLDLKIARLDDQDMITRTYQAAIRLLDTDPDLATHSSVKRQLKALLAKPTSAN